VSRWLILLPAELLIQSQSYVTTDGQSARLSWNKAPVWGLRPDLYYCQAVAGLLMRSALSEEWAGLSFARVQSAVISLFSVCTIYILHVIKYKSVQWLRYGFDYGTIWVRLPAVAKIFLFCIRVQTYSDLYIQWIPKSTFLGVKQPALDYLFVLAYIGILWKPATSEGQVWHRAVVPILYHASRQSLCSVQNGSRAIHQLVFLFTDTTFVYLAAIFPGSQVHTNVILNFM
jgi:hypothetical protein